MKNQLSSTTRTKYLCGAFLLSMIGLALGTIHAVTRNGISMANPIYAIVGHYLISPLLGYAIGKFLGVLIDCYVRRNQRCQEPNSANEQQNPL